MRPQIVASVSEVVDAPEKPYHRMVRKVVGASVVLLDAISGDPFDVFDQDDVLVSDDGTGFRTNNQGVVFHPDAETIHADEPHQALALATKKGQTFQVEVAIEDAGPGGIKRSRLSADALADMELAFSQWKDVTDWRSVQVLSTTTHSTVVLLWGGGTALLPSTNGAPYAIIDLEPDSDYPAGDRDVEFRLLARYSVNGTAPARTVRAALFPIPSVGGGNSVNTVGAIAPGAEVAGSIVNIATPASSSGDRLESAPFGLADLPYALGFYVVTGAIAANSAIILGLKLQRRNV